jgi:hypothetical protein
MTLLCAIEYGSADKERRCCRVAVAGAQIAELQCALVAAKSAAEKHCANIATTTT